MAKIPRFENAADYYGKHFALGDKVVSYNNWRSFDFAMRREKTAQTEVGA
jgi:hypothetical protein